MQSEFIDYRIHRVYRTSCDWCDSCDKAGSFNPYSSVYLVGLEGFYAGTDIPVSFLCKTDLQTFYWQEPMCLECTKHWVCTRQRFINYRILLSVGRIKRWWLRIYWAPRTGKGFLKAQQAFLNISSELNLK